MSMKEFAAGTGLNLTIPLINQNGESFAALSATYRLVDDLGYEVLGWTPVTSFTPGSTEVQVSIFSNSNTLADGTPHSARTVEVKAVTDIGTILVTETYILTDGQPLVTGRNSFLTYIEAALLARELPGTEAWQAETKANQVKVLMGAFSNIGYLKIKSGYSKRVTEMNDSELALLDPSLFAALKRAQLIEANYLLTADSTSAAMRDDGVVMMDVGESKQQWRQTKALSLHASKQTYKALTGWIDTSVRIGRS